MMIQYRVCHAQWDIEPSHEEYIQEHPEPSSTVVDDRTIRTRIFETEGDAILYAEKYFAQRKDDPWLAYLEIEKCEVEMIRKLK